MEIEVRPHARRRGILRNGNPQGIRKLLPSGAPRPGTEAPAEVLQCETDAAVYTEARVQGQRQRKFDAGFVSRCSSTAGTRRNPGKSGFSIGSSCVSAADFSIDWEQEM